jgi:hypothetical protein
MTEILYGIEYKGMAGLDLTLASHRSSCVLSTKVTLFSPKGQPGASSR